MYIIDMNPAFEVLSDPSRRRILDHLRSGERTAGDLGAGLSVSQPGVSRHLRILREAGLVTVRSEGQKRVYTLSPGPLAEIDAWLTPYRRLWAASLDRLEAHLDQEQ